MIRRSSIRAIMFADIGGSSALYNVVGDVEAKNSIDKILKAIKLLVSAQQGKVIKTIGDEVMCAFPDSTRAVTASITMQKQLTNFLKQQGLSLNIGLGFGKVIKDRLDLFGNVVNEAAHLTHLANGGQILITEQCFKSLDREPASFAREFDRITFKGANKSSHIYRIYWQNEARHGSETRLMTANVKDGIRVGTISVNYQGKEFQISSDETPYTIGRDVTQCDLLVDGSEVSRKHCHIDYSRGKFVLIDHSTNGSYLISENKDEMYIRRETLPLVGTVCLSLGLPIDKAGNNKIELTI